MNHSKFIQKAIEKSKESFDQGMFPAGAVIVKNNEIIAEAISGAYPTAHIHAEINAINEAFKKITDRPLSGCALYASMESCLMCISAAYWAGIRKMFFVIPRNKTYEGLCFESDIESTEFTNRLYDEIEITHLSELEAEALTVYKKWEDKIKDAETILK